MITLGHVAAQLPQQGELVGGLHALGRNLPAQRVRQLYVAETTAVSLGSTPSFKVSERSMLWVLIEGSSPFHKVGASTISLRSAAFPPRFGVAWRTRWY